MRAGFNDDESPLARLARRRGRDGATFLTAEEVEAGERLRGHFTRGQLMPGISQRWDAQPRGQGSRGGGDVSDSAIDARSAAACGPLIHGTVSTSVAGAPDANTTARPRGSAPRSAMSRVRSRWMPCDVDREPRPTLVDVVRRS